MTKTNLPDSLQPTAADRARDAELAREAESILGEIKDRTGMGVKTGQRSYDSVTFGADGSVVSRVTGGVSQMSREEEAVAKAQSASNAELQKMQTELDRLTAMRDEITGYNPDGSPHYVRSESARKTLEAEIRSLKLGLVNQTRLNERRWRNEAAQALQQGETARDVMRDLEARGKVTRVSGW